MSVWISLAEEAIYLESHEGLIDPTELKNTQIYQTGITDIASHLQTRALVPATGRRLVILLLAWISLWRGSSSLRRTLLILSLTLTLSIAARGTVLALGRLLAAVALLRRLLRIALLRRILALAGRRLLILTLARGSPITALTTVLSAGRRTVTAGGGVVGLLILRVVAAINRTKQKFDNPEIGSEIDRGVGASHFLLLVLEVCTYVSMIMALETLRTYWKYSRPWVRSADPHPVC